MSAHVVATAGHVDHGKSTLVEALTGTDPDRWAEEKARGLTIDLGFASTTLASGREVAFVDVPGHHRFVSNMLAGAGAADACLFVVSAIEGWKEQSEEHLRILELLGVTHGVVALTHTAALDAAGVAAAEDLLRLSLAGSFLEHARVVPVDVHAGLGVEALIGALDELLAATPEAPDQGRPRLWVDRSFTLAGIGTVVTGTLTGGTLRVGEALVTVPWRADGSVRARGERRSRRSSLSDDFSDLPALDGRPVQVRALQTFHRDVTTVRPGHRVAVRLGGASRRDLARGDALVRAEQWHATATVDASLTVLLGAPGGVQRRGSHVVHVGSGELPARLRVLGGDAIPPGGHGYVRLQLPVALPLLPGDRFVLRDTGRAMTVGGGEILDIDPVLPALKANPDRRVDRVVAERGWVDADDLERLTGQRVASDVGRWVASAEALQAMASALQERVEAAGAAGLGLAELDDRERALAATSSRLTTDGSRLVPRDADDPLAAHPFVAALEAELFRPPAPCGLAPGELRALAERGLAVEREGVWFSPAAVREAGRRVGELLERRTGGVTVGEVRDLLDTSRRWVVPLLGLLDAAGYTRRQNGLRVRGSRAPGGDH